MSCFTYKEASKRALNVGVKHSATDIARKQSDTMFKASVLKQKK